MMMMVSKRPRRQRVERTGGVSAHGERSQNASTAGRLGTCKEVKLSRQPPDPDHEPPRRRRYDLAIIRSPTPIDFVLKQKRNTRAGRPSAKNGNWRTCTRRQKVAKSSSSSKSLVSCHNAIAGSLGSMCPATIVTRRAATSFSGVKSAASRSSEADSLGFGGGEGLVLRLKRRSKSHAALRDASNVRGCAATARASCAVEADGDCGHSSQSGRSAYIIPNRSRGRTWAVSQARATASSWEGRAEVYAS